MNKQIIHIFIASIGISFISACTKNNEYTFIDVEPPEAASGLSWQLAASSMSGNASIVAHWKVAKSPDADLQYIQFYSDENCSIKMGEETKLTLEVDQFGLPVPSTVEGPFTYNVKTTDKNGHSTLSNCSLAYKVFDVKTAGGDETCMAPGVDQDKKIAVSFPPINPELKFLNISEIKIKDLQTGIEFPAEVISNETRKYSFLVPGSKLSDLIPNASETLVAKKDFEVTFLLNTGFEFKDTIHIGIDGTGPQVQLVIDPVYATKSYCKPTDPDSNCQKFIPIELKEISGIPAEHKGCAKLAQEPFQLSFVDNTDVEIERETNFFKEKIRQVEWKFERHKRVRLKINVKSDIGTEYYLLSEGLFNSGYQYIAGQGYDGDGELATLAKLTGIAHLAYNRKSNYFCYFETASHKIRCARPGGKIFTVSGNGGVGTENEILATLTGADFTKISLPSLAYLTFIEDDLYFLSENRILRKISLEFESATGRVKPKAGARLEAVTPYFHSENEIQLVCKNYSIPGICSLNTPLNKVPESLSLWFNSFFYEPNVNAQDNPYFNKEVVYLSNTRIVFKYDLKNNILEPVLGIGSNTKSDGDAAQYIPGVVAHSGLEFFSGNAMTRGPGNTLILPTVKNDSLRMGNHNIISLNLEGSAIGLLNNENIKAPYAKYIFEQLDTSWPKLVEFFKNVKGGLLVFSQSNSEFTKVNGQYVVLTNNYQRGVVPLNINTPLPIKISECQGCRFLLDHKNNGDEVGLSQDTFMAIRSVSETAVNILSATRTTAEIFEHRIVLGSPSPAIQKLQTLSVHAGRSFESIAQGSEKQSNFVLLDRPNSLALDAKNNHLYFMDGAGQEIKKLNLNSSQLSSFYGLKDYATHVHPEARYNNNDNMLTFRAKDESLLFSFHATTAKLFKRSAQTIDRTVPPVTVLTRTHQADVVTPIIPNGTPSYDSTVAKYGLFSGFSFIHTLADGSLFLKDFNYQVTDTIPQYSRIYKILPCNAPNKDTSCANINDIEGRSFFIAGKPVYSLYPVLSDGQNLFDITLGLNHGFVLDKEENIYLYDVTTVFSANHKSNIVKKIASIPDVKIAALAVGESADGKKKIIYVLASVKNGQSKEEVFESPPYGQNHNRQEGISKFYLYSVVIKENGVDVPAPTFGEPLTDFGEGSLFKPSEMLVDNEGNVIIAEYGANRILKYFTSK